MNKQIWTFIQYSLDDTKNLPHGINDIDWFEFFEFCCRQGIAGIVLSGVDRMNQAIPQDVLLEWIGFSEFIKMQNKLINERMINIIKWWKDRGYNSIVLKGQANATMYPNPSLRTPGDIDIWVEGQQSDIIRVVRDVCKDSHYSLHHITMPVYQDVSVEVHYSPAHLNNWCKDKKLQKYIKEKERQQFANLIPFGSDEISILTDEFNLVYQMLHMHGHFFTTRNNLKQMVDYYYLLKKVDVNQWEVGVKVKFIEFGISKYAGGVMWIMRNVLGLDEKLLIVEENEMIGKVILREINDYGLNTGKSKLTQVLYQMRGNIRLLKFFPSKVLIFPIYLVWHLFWKLRMKLKLQKQMC